MGKLKQKIARAVTSMTTTGADEVDVFYANPTAGFALVKWPGRYISDALGRQWVSADVYRYTLDAYGNVSNPHGCAVWNCSRDKDGPLTAKRKQRLIQKQIVTMLNL